MRFPLFTILIPSVLGALVHPRATAPTVRLDNGVFIGGINNTVSQFLGIPFGQSTCVLVTVESKKQLLTGAGMLWQRGE